MARRALPEGATPLWRWMAERRITLEVLAERLKITPQHLGDLRRGVRRPSDDLKIAIAAMTTQIEREMGIAASKVRGVPIISWYEGA